MRDRGMAVFRELHKRKPPYLPSPNLYPRPQFDLSVCPAAAVEPENLGEVITMKRFVRGRVREMNGCRDAYS
jgi:hypothetical protein